jgi:FkbM family methyltransferase
MGRGESRDIAIKRILREVNKRFPEAGLPKPSLSLDRLRIRFYAETAMSRLGIREYSTVRFPVNGSSFNVNVRSGAFWNAIEERRFEPDCLEHLTKVMRVGSRVLDIGAGFGAYSLLFSRMTGSRGEVHAFEPDPVSREILGDNVRRNRVSNVHVQGLCVSSTLGTTILRSRKWGSGRSTIMEHADPQARLERKVETTTVDRFCEDNNLRPDGMKIDVEGAEGLVLAGAVRTIEKCSPWILLEFHGGLAPEELKANWLLATNSAKKVIYLDGSSKVHSYGDELDSTPDSHAFHVFIEH